MLSQVVLSLQLSFAVIPLIQLVSDRRWMGQYTISRWLQAGGWVVAGVIAALNLKLVFDALVDGIESAGSRAWILWTTAVPLAVGLIALLVYSTSGTINQHQSAARIAAAMSSTTPVRAIRGIVT